MTDLEPPIQRSLCYRICCCQWFTSSSKEPPVQLIRSGALHATHVANGHISAAENTVDGFVDVDLGQPSTNDNVAGTSRPRIIAKKEHDDGYNMNDLMMADVLREDNHDEIDAVVEDAISISTNVIEEVDEDELSRLRLHHTESVSEPNNPSSKNDDEQNPSDRTQEGATEQQEQSLRSEEDLQNLPAASTSQENHLPLDSESETEEQTEEDTSRKDTESSEAKESPQQPEVLSEKAQPVQAAGVQPIEICIGESDTDEEGTVKDVTPVVYKPFEPPSLPPKSIMYADTSSDEDSDDEDSREVLPPVQRSPRVMNIDQFQHGDQLVNGTLEKKSANLNSGKNPFDSSSDDETIGDTNEDMSKEDGIGVTRILVRDDGRPHMLSNASVKLKLDGRESITDEEFSEKLI